MGPEDSLPSAGPLSDAERASAAGLVGAHLRQVLDESSSLHRPGVQRARLIAAMELPPRWGRKRLGFGFPAWRPVGLALAGAVALVLALRWAPADHQTPAQLAATHAGEAVAMGQWLRAVGSSEAVLFSDGTRMTLGTAGRMRLAELTAQGAVVTLEQGHLDAEVVPGAGYRWVFRAGHYSVTVLGTVLSLDWEPSSERLVVRVARGRVRVEDDRIEDSASIVSAGGKLEVGGAKEVESVDELGPTPAAEPAALEAAQEASEGAVSAVASSRAGAGPNTHRPRSTRQEPRGSGVTARAKASPRAVSRPRSGALGASSASAGPVGSAEAELVPVATGPTSARWERLAEDGLYAEAMRAAETDGVLVATSGLSAVKLWRLADAARLAGDHTQARRVLMDLRERFPTHRYAQSAAYNLGRMAFDVRDFREALSWFERYLAGGRGDSDEAARARVFMALQELGQRGAGAKAAADYLRRYPQGPNAGRARALSVP